MFPSSFMKTISFLTDGMRLSTVEGVVVNRTRLTGLVVGLLERGARVGIEDGVRDGGAGMCAKASLGARLVRNLKVGVFVAVVREGGGVTGASGVCDGMFGTPYEGSGVTRDTKEGE
jgi:hypothetical protein